MTNPIKLSSPNGLHMGTDILEEPLLNAHGLQAELKDASSAVSLITKLKSERRQRWKYRLPFQENCLFVHGIYLARMFLIRTSMNVGYHKWIIQIPAMARLLPLWWLRPRLQINQRHGWRWNPVWVELVEESITCVNRPIVVCYVIICSILNHILDFGYSGERIYFGFIEEMYIKISNYKPVKIKNWNKFSRIG